MTEAAALANAFEQAGLDQRAFTYEPKPGPPTPLRTHLGPDAIFTVAVDAEGRRQNLIEQACRTWAADHGIRCPRVLRYASAGDWMLAERVLTVRPEGSAYVHAALDTADRVAAAELPELPAPASQWRASRRSRVVRVARSVVGRLDVAGFVGARRAATALRDVCTSHGDFYRRNVLASDAGSVSVIDWEFVGPAPRWTDHLRLWSTLRREDDRAEAWHRITADRAAGEIAHLRVLTRWLSLRLLAENLAAPPTQRNTADLAHARRVVVEARSLSAALP
jgi:hypothetical protein